MSRMPRIDLVLALIRAGSRGDAVGLRSAAEAIASEEAQHGHNVAAERVRSALEPSGPQSSLSLAFEQADDLLIEMSARTGLDSLVLDERTKGDLSTLVKEQKNAKKLYANGLSPRHRVLLSGLPGNGKTSVAEALAHDLQLPFKLVSYGSLIGSLLGETNRRMETLFVQAAAKPCVLFFDEFEALGKERSDRQETGEMKRALASLLTKIDTLPSSVVVVAATNHPEMLDRAVWRRFELKLILHPPNSAQVVGYLIKQLGLEHEFQLLQLLAQCFSTTSYAELKDFSLDVKRRAILDGKTQIQALCQEIEIRFPEIDWPFDDDRSNKAPAAAQPTQKRRKTERETTRSSR